MFVDVGVVLVWQRFLGGGVALWATPVAGKTVGTVPAARHYHNRPTTQQAEREKTHRREIVTTTTASGLLGE